MTLAASFASTRVYPDAAVIVVSLSGAWACVFAAFLLLVDSRFRRTFVSMQTGGEWARSLFLEGERDITKIIPIGFNKKLWAGIREDVKAWTMENWERWEEEKPEWFNDAWKAQIDADMIPGEFGGREEEQPGGSTGGGGKVNPVAGGGEEAA
jgi:hypothetical protein